MNELPPKLKASAAGECLEYVVAGSGPATVVLVNGSGGPVEGWYKVFEPIASFAKVFAYNRPGIGESSKPQVRQTGPHMVASLRAALRVAGLSPPYVLVGHSLGGLIVNLFARVHPSEVSAAVLVEATAPKDVLILEQHENAVQRFLRTLSHRIAPPEPNAEILHVRSTAAGLLRAPPFPPVPLTVISGGKPAMAWAIPAKLVAARIEHQRELAALSPHAKHITAAASGHFPQLTEPDLVVAAIKEAAGKPAARDVPRAALARPTS